MLTGENSLLIKQPFTHQDFLQELGLAVTANPELLGHKLSWNPSILCLEKHGLQDMGLDC